MFIDNVVVSVSALSSQESLIRLFAGRGWARLHRYKHWRQPALRLFQFISGVLIRAISRIFNFETLDAQPWIIRGKLFNAVQELSVLQSSVPTLSFQRERIDYDRAFSWAINVSAMVAGVSATAIPAAFSALIFPAAVPLPPEIIAPA